MQVRTRCENGMVRIFAQSPEVRGSLIGMVFERPKEAMTITTTMGKTRARRALQDTSRTLVFR